MSSIAPTLLHLPTRYLTASQQAQCLRNPTYAASLQNLRAFAKELEQIRGLIDARELGKLPESIGKTKKQQVRHSLESAVDDKQALRAMEQRLREWDDQLAALAEALCSKLLVAQVHSVDMLIGADYIAVQHRGRSCVGEWQMDVATANDIVRSV